MQGEQENTDCCSVVGTSYQTKTTRQGESDHQAVDQKWGAAAWILSLKVREGRWRMCDGRMGPCGQRDRPRLICLRGISPRWVSVVAFVSLVH